MSGGPAPATQWARLASEVLVVGVPGPWMERATRDRLAALAPAGCILFARNVESGEQIRALCDDLTSLLGDPLLLIDQEGGRVDRLRAFRGRTRTARALALEGADEVEAEASRTARDLAALGLNFNCAPVVDLDEGHEANGIGDRSFGPDPDTVIAMAVRVLEAHAREGIATSLKHFPGLGRTRLDTHLARPAVEATREELVDRELRPFRALLDRCPSVMVCHASVPALTGDDTPASLSHAVIEGVLRRDLGYEGLVVSDDLAMGAVSDRPASVQAVEAIEAGCDLLLYCQGELDAADAAARALAQRAAAEPSFGMRLAAAAARVRGLRRDLARAASARPMA